MIIKTIGFPTMYKEEGEVRAFLPSFIQKLGRYDVDVYIDKNYGNKMGYNSDDYISVNSRVKVVSHYEVYKQDLVIVLKAPNHDELDQMKENSGLISMLHYDSKPELRAKLKDNKIISFSMDSVMNDEGQRMVVTYEQTAWGGVCTAIDEMEKRRKDFYSSSREPFNILIMGMGNLGVNAGRSCFRYLAEKLKNYGGDAKIPGMLATYFEKDTTKSKDDIRKLFAETDLLIDATKRADFTEYIFTNDLIGCLKENAIILDLTADPYYTTMNPIQVKAIEGLPYGTLDKYVFEVDAPEYENIPKEVRTEFRRVTVSCNGWPGVFPRRAMEIYEKQLESFIEVLMKKGLELSKTSENLYERALYRSTMDYFEENK
jgi:alanine dehydrogenase